MSMRSLVTNKVPQDIKSMIAKYEERKNIKAELRKRGIPITKESMEELIKEREEKKSLSTNNQQSKLLSLKIGENISSIIKKKFIEPSGQDGDWSTKKKDLIANM